MSKYGPVLLPILGYLVLARLVMDRLKGRSRQIAFALLNLAALYCLFFYTVDHRYDACFLLYVGLAALQYFALRCFASQSGWKPWLAFALPILGLIAVRYILPPSPGGALFPKGFYFVGISYFAFRCSHLVLEVRNRVVAAPDIFAYFGFCFFLPTISVGPINPYSNHVRAFAAEPPTIPLGRAVSRIIVGLVKFKFFASIFFQLTYANLLLDDHAHPWIDLPIAAVFYYLYLYCNFSGFCDAAIGAAGLLGIPVAENFHDPFLARNAKELWNRWHITLSQYMRDVVFSPLAKFFARRLSAQSADHAVTIPILVVFLLIGIWHGTGLNFAIFGAVHAVGVAGNHYYTLALKRRLGREGFKAYNANPWIHAAMVGVTFCYMSASLFFFANNFDDIQSILAALR